MSRMKKVIEERREAEAPTYSIHKKKKTIYIPKWLIVTVAILAVLALALYLPPQLAHEDDVYYRPSVAIQPNEASMEAALTYLRNHPEADFDSDGLLNEQELKYDTSVYNVDTDNDGTTDYAELYITETNPAYADDAIIRYVKADDTVTGNMVNTPFKIHDVIMWADDYTSKARGTVVLLANGGYRFNNFKGYAQFPNGEYTYKLDNGIQTPMRTNKNGYTYIDGKETTVYAYPAALPKKYSFSFLGNAPVYMEDNFVGMVLSKILPSKGKGLIICKEVTENDINGSMDETAYVNSNFTYPVDISSLDPARFNRNQTMLADLAYIRNQIDEGYNVIISLMSHSVGESIVMVYGYTNYDNLMVCDPETGEKLGAINIHIKSSRLLNENGIIQQYESFDFNGCGYNSRNKHRLAVLDSVVPRQNNR